MQNHQRKEPVETENGASAALTGWWYLLRDLGPHPPGRSTDGSSGDVRPSVLKAAGLSSIPRFCQRSQSYSRVESTLIWLIVFCPGWSGRRPWFRHGAGRLMAAAHWAAMLLSGLQHCCLPAPESAFLHNLCSHAPNSDLLQNQALRQSHTHHSSHTWCSTQQRGGRGAESSERCDFAFESHRMIMWNTMLRCQTLSSPKRLLRLILNVGYKS